MLKSVAYGVLILTYACTRRLDLELNPLEIKIVHYRNPNAPETLVDLNKGIVCTIPQEYSPPGLYLLVRFQNPSEDSIRLFSDSFYIHTNENVQFQTGGWNIPNSIHNVLRDSLLIPPKSEVIKNIQLFPTHNRGFKSDSFDIVHNLEQADMLKSSRFKLGYQQNGQTLWVLADSALPISFWYARDFRSIEAAKAHGAPYWCDSPTDTSHYWYTKTYFEGENPKFSAPTPPPPPNLKD